MATFTDLVDLATAQATSILTPHQAVLTGTGLAGQFVNEGYHLMESQAPWPWSFKEATVTCVPGDRELAMPADLAVVNSLHDDNNNALQFVDLRQRRFDTNTASSRPGEYGRVGDVWIVWPPPDQAYDLVLYYIKAWATLSGSDVPIIPEAFHHLLSKYATWQMLQRYTSVDSTLVSIAMNGAALYRKDWQAGLEQMIHSHLTSMSLEPVDSFDADTQIYAEGW